MSAGARAWTPATIETFEVWLERQGEDTRWELVGGEIVAMTSASEVHEQIVSNIARPLLQSLHGERCRVYVGGMGVQRSDDKSDTDQPRPDIVVRCGPLGRRNFITDPVVVIEVLSPSTIDIDRGQKLAFYKTLPTLRHVVLVYQDQIRIELYARTEDGWEPEALTTPTARLAFESPQFEMTLEQAYFGVDVAG
jgi:Uma2 family endonuclease